MEPRWAFPTIRSKLKCVVSKVSFNQAILTVLEVDDKKPATKYTCLVREQQFDENNLMCDRMKRGDIVGCIVKSYGDGILNVAIIPSK